MRFHYSRNKIFDYFKPNPHLEYLKDSSANVQRQDDEKYFCLENQKLKIKIYKEKLKIEIYDYEGDLLTADESELGFWTDGQEVRSYRKYSDPAKAPCIYGLGDKTGPINRWGNRFKNLPIDALGYDGKFTDPMYKDIPFFIHLENNKAHGIFFDNFFEKFFDFGRERKPSPYYYFGASGGDLNYYFFAGPSIKKIVTNYLRLTGMPCQMPDFAFGYLASGMSYTENYAQEQNADQSLFTKFKQFEANQVACTAFHLSSGYIQNTEGLRHQFIWNKNKFPDPQNFAQQAKAMGIRLTANIKPVLLCSHPWYKEAEKYFIKDDNNKTIIVDYWGGPGSYMDFTNVEAQQWWKDKIKNHILEQEIYGIWNDNNEYEIFEKYPKQDRKLEMILLMSKLAFEASLESGTKEPWILTRSGYSGIQKYAQTWTGDNYSSWEALQYDSAILSSASLSGLVHIGSDIGGFWGPDPDPELLLRWIQNGVFTPRFCIHSYKAQATEPDMFQDSHPEFFEIIKKFMKLRTKLIPYIKEQGKKAFQEGIPIMRPTVYDFQDDAQTFNQSFEYMFGEKFLVAPIYKPRTETVIREIYLPGNNIIWKNYFTGEKFKSGQVITIKTNFEYIPVFELD